MLFDVAEKTISPTAQLLPVEFHNIIQVMCDTFEKLDLRIETTLANAARDLCLSLPEIHGHDSELGRLADMLVRDLRRGAETNAAQPVLLHLAFNDKQDLIRKLQSTLADLEA